MAFQRCVKDQWINTTIVPVNFDNSWAPAFLSGTVLCNSTYLPTLTAETKNPVPGYQLISEPTALTVGLAT